MKAKHTNLKNLIWLPRNHTKYNCRVIETVEFMAKLETGDKSIKNSAWLMKKIDNNKIPLSNSHILV